MFVIFPFLHNLNDNAIDEFNCFNVFWEYYVSKLASKLIDSVMILSK